MYLIRRIARTKPGKEWEAAALLTNICEAYEAAGRAKARIYSGRGLPGDQHAVYAEWTQESIEPNHYPNIPASVLPDNAKLQEMLTSYDLEFFEVITREKLEQRGLV